MIPGDLLSAFTHRQFHTLPGLLDSWAALPNSYPNACMPMQGGSLYHFYDGLWYDPAERRTHDLPCERRTRYRLSQPDTVWYSFCSCVIALLHGNMNRHCGDPGCCVQTLEGRSLIGFNASFFNVMTSMLYQYDQSRPLSISSGAVGMTMHLFCFVYVRVDLIEEMIDIVYMKNQNVCSFNRCIATRHLSPFYRIHIQIQNLGVVRYFAVDFDILLFKTLIVK